VISGNLLCARVDCWIIIAVDAVEIYRRLSTARRLAKQVVPPSRIYSDFSLAAGYAVARLLDEEMLADGAMRVGTKLGFTNQDVWSQVGLDTPFWSPIYDTTVTETLSVSLAGLVPSNRKSFSASAQIFQRAPRPRRSVRRSGGRLRASRSSSALTRAGK
jgi:hypothetical protein